MRGLQESGQGATHHRLLRGTLLQGLHPPPQGRQTALPLLRSSTVCDYSQQTYPQKNPRPPGMLYDEGAWLSGRGGWRTYKCTWMWTQTTASTWTWSAPTSAARASRGSSCPHTWQTPAPTETSSATTATSQPPNTLSAMTTGRKIPTSPCCAPTAARSGPWSEPTWRTTSKCACCRRWRVG